MAMRTDDTDVRPVRDLLRRLIAAPAAWSFLWPIVLIIVGYVGYNRWGADRLATKFQGVRQDQITIPPPHRYIRTDIVAETYKDYALGDVSQLDPKATARIAASFANHPWVRNVDSVRKLPHGEIDVRLEYRVPVAVFHVTSSVVPIADDHYLALDGEGVFLPNEKLTLDDAAEMIQIEVMDVQDHIESGIYGEPFGERRVEAAARLAKLLVPLKSKVHVTKITSADNSRGNFVPQLEITIGNNTRLFWGSPPGQEQPNERDALEKAQDLINGNYQSGDDLRVAKRSPSSF